jgi:NADPH2:quinone reductase
MKAIRIEETGGPEVLKIANLDDPRPGKDQALIEVQAIGVNYADVYARAGSTPLQLPAIPGQEAAGVVIEIGPGVSEVNVGDIVAYTGVPGAYAEKVVAPAWRLVKLPPSMDAETGAATMLQAMTAHYLCYSTYQIQAGDIALIHAGAGGVGALLIQMCKWLGAEVIATVSTDAKAEVAREAGADHTVNYATQDFEEEVVRITNGAGVHVAYDAVGASTFDKSLASLARRGCLALYGQASGPVPSIAPGILGPKSVYLTRPGLGNYTATREELVQRADDVLGWVESGKLKLRIHGKFSIEDASEAHRQLEGRLTTGKLLLIP